MSVAPQPPRRGRPQPSRGPILVRRAFAAVVVLVLLGVAGFIAVKAPAVFDSVGGSGSGSADGGAEIVTQATETEPQVPPLRIVFPEGFNRKEMGARVAAVNEIAREERGLEPKLRQQQYLDATAEHALPGQLAGDSQTRNLEGFLFPATYDFTEETTTQQLVDRQLEAFRTNWAKVDQEYAKSKNLTEYEVLIIASMVEKETVAPDERPLVAAVIYNRLRLGMPLGIDATIRYGLDVPGTESLRQSHLQSDNPYNTRNRLGLPPTPIANPGLASMQAAAHPADVDFLYFVREPDGVHHFFTASESEFYAKACEYGFGCG